MALEKKLSTTTVLSAFLAASIASLGITGAAVSANAANDYATMSNASNATGGFAMNNTATTTNTTTASDSSTMGGVIASIQRDNEGNLAWITAGHWWLESDAPLVGQAGNTTAEPRISNFTADLVMVSNANGTMFHTHKISNFNQTSIVHNGVNATTVNGTFTVTLREGPVDNVMGYIHIINDKLEFWIDPGATDSHFGPTAITGIVLKPDKMMHAGDMTMTQGTTNMTEGWRQ